MVVRKLRLQRGWSALGWGVGLIVHALNVYEVINVLGPAWEKKQIEKRLGRPL
jgi:hypothetical protein